MIKLVNEEMGRYKLYKVVPKLVIFLENLTNWYVRLNRNRLKGTNLILIYSISQLSLYFYL